MDRLHLFEAFGIELEYMLVDRRSLAVRPVAEELLRDADGVIQCELERGSLAWSNELVAHVIELKTNGPTTDLRAAAEDMQAHLRTIDDMLEPHGARLMPTGMHPFMDPATETVLWPHEYSPVYERFDAIFGCSGHGWSNLQSMHINLPFADDAEFARLHAAIRLLLPVLPALTASSPIHDGKLGEHDDGRMAVYRTNARRIPSVAGMLVPEPVWDRASYEGELLGRIYEDLRPHDPEGILRHEFVNARGAIARFDRYAIEIRVLDTQEHPGVDLAVAAAITDVLRALVDGRWIDTASQQAWDTRRLADILDAVITRSDRTLIDDADYLAVFGVDAPCTAGALWRRLLDAIWPSGSAGATTWRPTLDVLLEQGSLARRLRAALGEQPDHAKIVEVYTRLCECLRHGQAFVA